MATLPYSGPTGSSSNPFQRTWGAPQSDLTYDPTLKQLAPRAQADPKALIPNMPAFTFEHPPMYWDTQAPGGDAATASAIRYQQNIWDLQAAMKAPVYSAGGGGGGGSGGAGQTTYGGTLSVQRKGDYSGPVLDLRVQTGWTGASAADEAYRQLEIERQKLLTQQTLPPTVDQVAPSTVASSIPGPAGGASTYGTLTMEEAQAQAPVASSGELVLEEKKPEMNLWLIAGVAVLFFMLARRIGTK